MPCTHSDFDPVCLSQYEDPPSILHFQWEGRRSGNLVYRYALVEAIEPKDIDPRSKKKADECHLSPEDIRLKALSCWNSTSS